MGWLFKSSVKSAAAAKTRENLFNLSIHVEVFSTYSPSGFAILRREMRIFRDGGSL